MASTDQLYRWLDCLESTYRLTVDNLSREQIQKHRRSIEEIRAHIKELQADTWNLPPIDPDD